MHNPILDMEAMEGAFPTQQEYIESINEHVEGTVFESLSDVFDEIDLEWMDVLHENREHLTVDAVIGTEGFETEDLMQHGQVLKVLSENPNTSMNDIRVLHAKLYLHISEVIEANFGSDSEYIDYVDETNLFGGDRESLEKGLEEHLDEDPNDTPLFVNFLQGDKQFNSSIAKAYNTAGKALTIKYRSFSWDNPPEVGMYFVYTEENPVAKATVVGKLSEVKQRTHDVEYEFDEPNLPELAFEVDEYEFDLISYKCEPDSARVENALRHPLVEDDDELLAPAHQIGGTVDFFEQNPLPL
jgi:hypothetical protein